MSALVSCCLSGEPLADGSFRSSPFSSSGVVMTKMINSTNARSSSGVMLMSLNVTSELRWEKRLMKSRSFFEIFRFHLRHQFLRKVVQLDRQDPQVVHEPVVTEHRGN